MLRVSVAGRVVSRVPELMPARALFRDSRAASVVSCRFVTNRNAPYSHDAPASELPEHTRWDVVPVYRIKRISNSPLQTPVFAPNPRLASCRPLSSTGDALTVRPQACDVAWPLTGLLISWVLKNRRVSEGRKRQHFSKQNPLLALPVTTKSTRRCVPGLTQGATGIARLSLTTRDIAAGFPVVQVPVVLQKRTATTALSSCCLRRVVR